MERVLLALAAWGSDVVPEVEIAVTVEPEDLNKVGNSEWRCVE